MRTRAWSDGHQLGSNVANCSIAVLIGDFEADVSATDSGVMGLDPKPGRVAENDPSDGVVLINLNDEKQVVLSESFPEGAMPLPASDFPTLTDHACLRKERN